jgi:hypothetical protein
MPSAVHRLCGQAPGGPRLVFDQLKARIRRDISLSSGKTRSSSALLRERHLSLLTPQSKDGILFLIIPQEVDGVLI